MKKIIFLTFSLLIICILSVSAQSDDKFINALRTCSPSYKDSDTVNLGNITALSTKTMSGWKNNKCNYTEELTINGQNITTTCSFTKPQINEIVSVADAYFLTLKYSSEKVDTSSLDAVKNNPLMNVMNKYLQDSSVCSINGIQ